MDHRPICDMNMPAEASHVSAAETCVVQHGVHASRHVHVCAARAEADSLFTLFPQYSCDSRHH